MEARRRRAGTQQSTKENDLSFDKDGSETTVTKVNGVNNSENNKSHKQRLDVVHFNRPSLLSSVSGFTNYTGLLNLTCLLLILSNARVALENINKYGLLIRPHVWLRVLWTTPEDWPNIYMALSSNIFILLIFAIERAFAAKVLSERIGHVVQGFLLLSSLIIPAAVVLSRRLVPMFSMFTLSLYTVVFAKLLSYIAVNKWCRGAEEASDATGKVVYPNNLTLKDIYYFMCAPTLCYELNFAKTTVIRKRFLIRRVFEVVLLAQLIMALLQQWIEPTVVNSMVPFHNMEISYMIERLFKLAVPNIIIWLIFFYFFFHSFLNLTAELLYFADREFYKDWWNATSISQFWQTWNIPVHRWAFRHVYKPLLYAGYSRSSSAVVVFFVSAFFHEYLVSVPLGMFRVWAFMGMMWQLPLSALTAIPWIQGKPGNVLVWLSLMIGQPIAIMMYFHDYYVLNYGNVTEFNSTYR